MLITNGRVLQDVLARYSIRHAHGGSKPLVSFDTSPTPLLTLIPHQRWQMKKDLAAIQTFATTVPYIPDHMRGDVTLTVNAWRSLNIND